MTGWSLNEVRMNDSSCSYCDGPGGRKTYEHQACIPIKRRLQGIDFCIHQIVAALNAGNVGTTASCCGHKKMNGMITLEDGRTLLILPETPTSMKDWNRLLKLRVVTIR